MLLADQFCRIVQFAPSNSHHLYRYGAVPFVAVAVNVIGVPEAAGPSGLRQARQRQRRWEVIVSVSVAVLPAASRAVIVITFEPLCRATPLTLQLVVPSRFRCRRDRSPT